MINTTKRLPAYEFVPHDDQSVKLRVSIQFCLNNIGQRLTELMDSYRFFYLGLEAPDSSIDAYKQTCELRFPYSQKADVVTRRKFAESLLSANFILNLVEVANEELIEILLLLNAVRMATDNTSYEKITRTLHKIRKDLLGAKFPQLLKLLDAEIGPLTLSDHLASINQLRRTIVHRAGIVDTDQLDLKLFIPAILADNTFVKLSNPDTTPPVRKEMLIGKNSTVTWNRDSLVSMDYELCFKIVFTVVHFFGQVVNKAIPLKYPKLAAANETVELMLARGEIE